MKFDLWYADPPWKFRNEKTGGSHTSGSIQKYPVMELREIEALPVRPLVQDPAVLGLWVPTTLKFSHAVPVAHAWGFERYRTTVYWRKLYEGNRMGMGFWFRNCVEELLIFTRGDMEAFRCQEPNFIEAAAEEHSTKPDVFRDLLARAMRGTTFNYTAIELFARKRVPGWLPIGDVVTGCDIREDLIKLDQIGDSFAGQRSGGGGGPADVRRAIDVAHHVRETLSTARDSAIPGTDREGAAASDATE